MKNDFIITSQMKLKYLNYLPKPIHIDEDQYDLVGDDEFFKKDHRIKNNILVSFNEKIIL